MNFKILSQSIDGLCGLRRKTPADVFLTTDKNLLKVAKRLKLNVKALNPVNWFMEVLDNE